jgi:hypothetical protein
MEDLTGTHLGPYRIISPVGEGGMAAVYRAYQPSFDRMVALKVLPPQLALQPEFVARFNREARVIAKLVHPHILPVYDFGHAQGYTYLVMPFVQGCTLAQLIASGPLPLPRLTTILTQLADALDYAHARGVVHRDIKPANVLLDQTGHCLLTDFGLAQVMEEATRFTRPGEAIGTPAYMSPEQACGEKVDQRSDIYSLGVVLFEMATGRVPYAADTPVATVMKHIHDPLPSARALNPALPEAVDHVIGQAMAKDPAARFATAGQMAAALQAATGATNAAPGRGIAAAAAPPAVGPASSWAPARLGPGLLALAAAGLLLMGLLAGAAVAGVWIIAPRAARIVAASLATPPRSESRPGPVAADPLAGSSVLVVDDFDASRLAGWTTDAGTTATLDSGCLVLSGSPGTEGVVSLEAQLQEGQAALFLVQYEAGAQFRLALTAGQKGHPGWREWGLRPSAAHGFEPYADGGPPGGGALLVTGQMLPRANHWYLVLLQVGGTREFATRLWDRDAPASVWEWRQAMPPSWAGLKWNVNLGASAGRLIVDRYEQLALLPPMD